MLGKSRRRHPPRGARRGRPRGSRRGGGSGSLGRSDAGSKGGEWAIYFKNAKVYARMKIRSFKMTEIWVH